LAVLAAAVAAADADARDWVRFAHAFRAQGDDDDPATARAIALAGLARFGADATLLATAARAETDLGRVAEPIRVYQTLIDRGDGDERVYTELATLYRKEVGALAMAGRPALAAERLDQFEAFDARAAELYPGGQWDASLAAALATMGRGLARAG